MPIDLTLPDLAISIQIIVVSIGGLIVNGVLLAVITLNKDLRHKDYICFILNRTLVDFIFSLQLGSLQATAILLTSQTSTTCIAAGFMQLALASMSMYTEPLLACNRYMSIFHSDLYERVYTRGNICVMCVAIWIVGILSSVPHLFVGSLGRVSGSICSIRLAPDTLAVTIGTNYSFVLLSLVSILFFNCRMFRYLRSYQNKPMTNSQKTKLQSDREILRFIFVAAFLPLLFEAPSLVIFWIQMTRPISPWMTYFGMAIFTLSLPVNPAITLAMIKPIREEFLKAFENLRAKSGAVVSIRHQDGNVIQNA